MLSFFIVKSKEPLKVFLRHTELANKKKKFIMMKIELTPKQLHKMNYRLMKDPAKESNIHQTPQRRYLGFNLNSRDVRLKPAKLRQTRGYLAADLFDTLKRLCHLA